MVNRRVESFKNEGSNPFIKEFYKHDGGVVVNMTTLENNKRTQNRFVEFINHLTTKLIKKNRLKFILWDKYDEVVELYIYPDFMVRFDDIHKRLQIDSVMGRYGLSIPYRAIETVDVRVPGEYTKLIL
ncbi:MAG: hypothetical protein QXZ17_16080 [Nitrososphaerota archaeon]